MSDSSYPDALPAQYRLHWYVLERVLGQGGFGITYLARDTNLDQPVAIKEYLPADVATRRSDSTVRSRTGDQAERYRWGLDRFIREARTLARFDHPNIVRVHSVFEANNTAYMVMRFEEGEDLAALLEQRRTLPEDELRRIVLPLLDGLELVHDAGFIHRDIKPDNIYIRADGSPVLLDFGSARLAHGLARTVTVLVAPGYAPFEQYHSSGENQGPWTDIYGLGATCYRAIAGIEPIDAITRSRTELYQDKREALVPAINIGAGRYSPGFLQAIDHALAFAEKDRPQSIAEWRGELTSESIATSLPEHASVARAPVPAPASAPVSPSRAAAVRRPLTWAGFGTAVAVATLWLVLPKPEEPLPAPPTPPSAPRPSPVALTPPPTAPVSSPEQDAAAAERKARAARDAAAREAERIRREALEAKVAALEARVNAASDAVRKAEAARLHDAERARLDAEKRKQAEAERRRQEQARLAEEARAAREARQAGETRKADEARKARDATRDEARVTSPAPRPQVASLASTPASSSLSPSSNLPAPGTTWTYALVDRAYGRKRPVVTIQVVNSDSAEIREMLTTNVPGIRPKRRVVSVHDPNILQVPLGGTTILVEVAPYLLVADTNSAMLQSSPIKGYPQGAVGLASWRIRAETRGWQQVTVPAGRYRALVVDIDGEREYTQGVMWGQSGRFHIVAWYAPKVKRLVKLEHKSWGLHSLQLLEHDVVELLAFRRPD